MEIKISEGIFSPEYLDFEVIERKGLGHPDTLADGIAEQIEIDYCFYCLKNFGVILHHNFDKLSILGGKNIQAYRYSKFENPIHVIFFGRASKSFNGIPVPLEKIQIEAAKKYIKRILPYLDVDDEKQVVFESRTTDYSARKNWFSPKDKSDLPEYQDSGITANDTATMVSYWPLTTGERLALELESYFYEVKENNKPYPRFKVFGEDIKVMVVRTNQKYNITICVPQICKETPDEDTYFKRERAIKTKLGEFIKKRYPKLDFELTVNSKSKNANRHPYLTSTGSCIDFGEEGAVGRGNKTHGIISTFRPNTMEAPHGKNSTYFVGKVLGYLADQIAKEIYNQTQTKCQVILQVNSGEYLFEPNQVLITIENNVSYEKINEIIKNLLNKESMVTTMILESSAFIPTVVDVWKDK